MADTLYYAKAKDCRLIPITRGPSYAKISLPEGAYWGFHPRFLVFTFKGRDYFLAVNPAGNFNGLPVEGCTPETVAPISIIKATNDRGTRDFLTERALTPENRVNAFLEAAMPRKPSGLWA